MKINWRVRFSKKNITFIIRFLAALLIPILAYMGLRFEDLTTWAMVWNVVLQFISNPFLVGLTVLNAINILPDPTTEGISDSKQALNYEYPKKDVNGQW